MRFSIVLPLFNPGVYLRPAVESIRSQSFDDFELILVDDGSTDGSAEICDSFSREDSRVVVLHQKNGGICRARNAGMTVARGEYVMFCDHDDVYLPDYLANVAHEVASSEVKPDVVKVNISLADRSPDGKISNVFDGDDLGDFSWSWPSSYVQFERLSLAVWDGAYRRSFLTNNDISFDERYKFGAEDFDFMIRVLRRASVVRRLNVCRYRHFNNIGLSTSSVYYLERLDDILSVAKLENEIFPTQDWRLRLARYRRWNGVMLLCGLGLPNCPRALSFRLPYAEKIWKVLRPPSPTLQCLCHLSRDEFVFWLLQKFHMMWLYIWIKTLRLAAATGFRGNSSSLA